MSRQERLGITIIITATVDITRHGTNGTANGIATTEDITTVITTDGVDFFMIVG